MPPSLRVFSCLLSLPAICAPQAEAPLELDEPIRTFCHSIVRLTRTTELDANPNPSQIRALRAQAESLLEIAAKRFPSDHPTLALLQVALGTLLCAEGKPEIGEERFNQGSCTLAFRLKIRRMALGRQHPDLVPELQNIALLYELAGLRAAPWRDETLILRDRHAPKPDPNLEADLAAAIEDRYGPFLTVAELEPMLELCERLARRWEEEPKLDARTERILRLGLKADAERVWHLVALRGSPELCKNLEGLMDDLEVAQILERDAPALLCKLRESLRDTRLDTAARKLLRRVEKQGRKHLNLAQRRRLLEAIEDYPGALDLLGQELKKAHPREHPHLLREALKLSQGTPSANLLDQALPLLLELADKASSETANDLPRLLRDWAKCTEALEHFDSANYLIAQAQRLDANRPEAKASASELPAEIPDPEHPESWLGARLQALSRTDQEGFEALNRDAVRLLNPHHPFLAELLLARSERIADGPLGEALSNAQAALNLLETDKHLELRMKILSQIATLQAREARASDLEQTLRQWALLMEAPYFVHERFSDERNNLLVSYVMLLWREQRVDEIEQLPLHLLESAEKAPNLDVIRARIRRTARFQALLRAQGLP